MPFVERTDWVDTPSAPPPPGSTPVRAEGDIKRWERGIAEAHEQLDGRLSEEGLNSTYVRPETMPAVALDPLGMGSVDRARAAGLARLAWEDGSEGRENYWSTVATDWQGWDAEKFSVTSQKLYSLWASGGGNTQLYRSFTVTADKTFRLTGRITVPATAPAGNNALYAFIGITASAATPPGYPNAVGIGVSEFNRPAIYSVTGMSSTDAQQSGTALPAGDYTATIYVDENRISYTLTNADGSVEYKQHAPRSTLTNGEIKQITVINRDSRGVNGVGIGSLSWKAPAATARQPSSAIAENFTKQPIWLYPTATSTDNLRVEVPRTYDSRVPTPLVIFCHGSGRTAADLGNANTASMVRALSQTHGFLVAAGDFGGDAWGSQAAIDGVVDAYRWCRDHLHIGPVLLLAASMGGLTSLNTLARRDVPGIVGWYGMYPVTNLAYQYTNNSQQTGPIETAYGFTGASNYAAATEGHDPMLRDGWEFRGVPMRMAATDGDTAVTKANNADLFAVKVAPYAPEASILAGTGNHGDPSTTVVADVVAFFNRCLGVN